MKIDSRDLNDILDQLNSQSAYTKFADDIIRQEFEKVKKEILNEFNTHPVTVEIEGGICKQYFKHFKRRNKFIFFYWF